MSHLDAITDVAGDLAAGRALSALPDDPKFAAATAKVAARAARQVVDATLIYRQLAEKSRTIYMYDDHPNCAPPWSSAAVTYVNGHGNVVVMAMSAVEWAPGERGERWKAEMHEGRPPVDWDRVRWTMDVPIYTGGRGRNGPAATAGPLHMWRIAVYEDGTPADLYWVTLRKDHPAEHWDMAMVTFLGTLNFMGCRNITIVDAPATRSERRRQDRAGVTVKLLAVRPTATASRSQGPGPDEPLAVPLTTVVGKFWHYGDCCPGRHEPNGLLFGRLEGRYWHPPSTRGTIDLGEVRNLYQPRPTADRGG